MIQVSIARLLMNLAIATAQRHGKTLLTLDTRTGDAAEPLYRSLGFETAGVIPDWSRAPDSDLLEATTFRYLRLDPGPNSSRS